MAGIKRNIIFRQVLANLNASSEAYAAALSDNPAYDDLAVMDAILNVEANLIHKIAESWYNGNRTNEPSLNDFINVRQVQNGALVPRHLGPIISVVVDGVPAEYVSGLAAAQLQNRNPLKLQMQTGLWGLVDNRLYFTTKSTSPSATADVTLCEFARPSFTDLVTFKASDSFLPGEYHQAWVDLATGAVLPREGALLQAAMFHTRRGEGLLAELERENKLRPQAEDVQRSGA